MVRSKGSIKTTVALTAGVALVGVILAGLLLRHAASSLSTSKSSTDCSVQTGIVIVSFKAGTKQQDIQIAFTALHLIVLKASGNKYAVRSTDGASQSDVIARLQKDPNVVSAANDSCANHL